MTEVGTRVTAAQEVLLAAAAIYNDSNEEFSEWDLTVAAWKLNPNRFGCRGYEDKYPDHKRVMTEILGTTKKDNPVRHGWLRKIRANQYQITPLGLSEAQRIAEMRGSGMDSPKASQHTYDAVERYVFHDTFRSWLRDDDEPKTWVKAEIFLGLRHLTATALEDSLNRVRSAVLLGLRHLDTRQQDSFHRGSEGGGKAISRKDMEALSEFIDVLCDRFRPQMDAVRRRG